ncbi:MAG: phosphoglucosamine mutase [Clostridia bacterium]|nr:phosphoglucosamine mutase [Clostridia bacterium]
MGKYFGTDGVRGVANVELTAPMAYDIGAALAFSLGRRLGRKPRVCIGRDTRISGDMLECALAAGITACGGDVWLLGVMPTPAVAWLSREEQMDAGVVISASHNPFEHNGIKIFAGSGYKLDDDQEAEIEALMDHLPQEALRRDSALGRVVDSRAEGNARYAAYLRSLVQPREDGMKILIDCANGAASHTAREIFGAIGARCDFMACDPDGVNINNGCGSTHMEALRDAVREGGYDLGVAFDGDADRCLLCDEQGKMIDGDDILALLAVYMQQKGTLKGGVVATILSNMGLAAYLRPYGIDVCAVGVGDRHVLEEMRRSGRNIGGEQSGHVILSDCATTGDGQLTALQFISMLREKGCRASELTAGIYHYPQIMRNVPAPNSIKKQVAGLPAIRALSEEITAAFGGEGRVVIRPSGTEALVRVMVEGSDPEKVRTLSAYAEEQVKAAIAAAVQA